MKANNYITGSYEEWLNGKKRKEVKMKINWKNLIIDLLKIAIGIIGGTQI